MLGVVLHPPLQLRVTGEALQGRDEVGLTVAPNP